MDCRRPTEATFRGRLFAYKKNTRTSRPGCGDYFMINCLKQPQDTHIFGKFDAFSRIFSTLLKNYFENSNKVLILHPKIERNP